jgi:hypothetical protein
MIHIEVGSRHWIGSGKAGATFDETRKFRYTLWRNWSQTLYVPERCAFIGLNPSTADEHQLDPTVTRCVNWSKEWGFGGMAMLNLFAYRATDPTDMKKHPSPCGLDNCDAIRNVVNSASRVVLCWGNHGTHMDRAQYVTSELLKGVDRDRIFTFGTNLNGEPKHPLYLRGDTPLELWRA